MRLFGVRRPAGFFRLGEDHLRPAEVKNDEPYSEYAGKRTTAIQRVYVLITNSSSSAAAAGQGSAF